MEIPKDRELFETPISTNWIDDSGIVCGVANGKVRTLEDYKQVIEIFRKIKGDGERFCLLSDATHSPHVPVEAQKFFVNELPRYVKAQAIISESPSPGTLVGTVIKLSWNGFPIMKFNNEKEAREWLLERMKE